MIELPCASGIAQAGLCGPLERGQRSHFGAQSNSCSSGKQKRKESERCVGLEQLFAVLYNIKMSNVQNDDHFLNLFISQRKRENSEVLKWDSVNIL